MKISYKDLSPSLKTAIVLLWIIAAINGAVFLVELFRLLLIG